MYFVVFRSLFIYFLQKIFKVSIEKERRSIHLSQTIPFKMSNQLILKNILAVAASKIR